jgi:pyruvate formate lyase activating enzyme
MKIAGLVKSSLIDYPSKISAVIFTQGCNFRCGFCHNPDLIDIKPPASSYSEIDILNFLKTRVGKLDGVVITGGEPLIQPDVLDFIAKIKKLGFLVKLDTNGSNPVLLNEIINKKLVDYIAMDIKGPLDKYKQICGYSNTKFIQESIKIIKQSSLNYEFRTTVLPYYHEISDFNKVGKLISGATNYTIQGFRPQITLDPILHDTAIFSSADLGKIAKIMAPYVASVVIHPNN